MKTFLQTTKEPQTSEIDKLGHMVKYKKKHLKTLMREFPVFEHINLEDWQQYPCYKNSSTETENEIRQLISLGQLRSHYNDEIIMHDIKIMRAFKEYADEYGLEIDFNRINDIREQSEPIILSLKRYYNRPRPKELAKKLGLPLDTFPLKTAGSPSYPSGHATEGTLVSMLIADLVPLEHRKNILDIGKRMGEGRQIAGAHYPSDTAFGIKLGKHLYKLTQVGMEPDLKFEGLEFDLEMMLREAPEFSGTDEATNALELTGFIDDQISSISGDVQTDPRAKSSNGSKIGVQIILDPNDRIKFTTMAKSIITSDPDLTLRKVSSSRATKDFAFDHEELGKYVYVNTRPNTKRGGGSKADPNELMTAALCTLTSFDKVNTVEEMDALIDQAKKIIPKKVEGYTALELSSMDNDYENLAKAVSAARAIIKEGNGGADKVYLTAKAWHDDVKGFKRTKYGMADFNASDFIIKKGTNYIGISLKKKKSPTTADPTIINNSLFALLRKSGVEGSAAVADDLELAAGEFYIKIVKKAQRYQKRFPKKAIDKNDNPYLDKETLKDLGKRGTGITQKNWKKFVQRIPNEFVNSQLSKSTATILKPMADAIVDKADIFADILLEIIIKSTLRDLKKVHFEYALVTGIGRYLKSGIVVDTGDYTSVEVMATKLDELFETGKPNMKLNSNKTQAFDRGATAAIVHFDLFVGTTKISDLQLRYKGNFQSAPSFQAQLSKEFKEALK